MSTPINTEVIMSGSTQGRKEITRYPSWSDLTDNSSGTVYLHSVSMLFSRVLHDENICHILSVLDESIKNKSFVSQYKYGSLDDIKHIDINENDINEDDDESETHHTNVISLEVLTEIDRETVQIIVDRIVNIVETKINI